MMIYLSILMVVGFLYYRMPTSYIPDEDQGVLMVQANLPSGPEIFPDF